MWMIYFIIFQFSASVSKTNDWSDSEIKYDEKWIKNQSWHVPSLYLPLSLQQLRRVHKFVWRTLRPICRSETVLQAPRRTSPARTRVFAPTSRSAASTVSSGKDLLVIHDRCWLKDHVCVCVCSLVNSMSVSLRYLESCNIPITVKRKYKFSVNTTSSNSDDGKKDSEEAMQMDQDTNTGMWMSLRSNSSVPLSCSFSLLIALTCVHRVVIRVWL